MSTRSVKPQLISRYRPWKMLEEKLAAIGVHKAQGLPAHSGVV